MNPRIDPAIIEEAYLADEVAARSDMAPSSATTWPTTFLVKRSTR